MQLEFYTVDFPTRYSEAQADWHWNLKCRGYIDPSVWDLVHREKACYERHGDWIYRFIALPIIIDRVGPIRVDGVLCRYPGKLAQHIMEKAYPGELARMRSDFEDTKADSEAYEVWKQLSPRYSVASQLCERLGFEPVLGGRGSYCSFCDTGSERDWVVGDGFHMHHSLSSEKGCRDYSDRPLRWSEFEIIEKAMRSGELNCSVYVRTRRKARPTSIFTKLLGRITR